MRSRFPGGLTYANVVATLALFLALGGVAYAGVTLGRGAVHRPNLATGAVASRAVADHSLRSVDLRLASVRRELGVGHTRHVVRLRVHPDQYGFASATARCPHGEAVLAGGAAWNGPAQSSDVVMQSRPLGRGWHAVLGSGNNGRAGNGSTATVYAICAP